MPNFQCLPILSDLSENEGSLEVQYVFGLSKNETLDALVFAEADEVQTRRAIGNLDAVRDYAETRYAAKSWSRPRRVVARIEATRKGLAHLIRGKQPIRGKLMQPRGFERAGRGKICHDRFLDIPLLSLSFIVFRGNLMNKTG